MTEDQPAIQVKNIIKSFRIPVDKSRSVKSKLLGKASKGHREFTPLNGISFTVEKGDFFGIVGRNGSGKSTLLKTIAGIYSPSKGSVKVNGRLVPFIELGVGFNPQLTGKDNTYLNGALLGFSRREMDAMYDDIVEFAELHDFMEERLQNYSSGMQVRLAFSIAIRAKGDILLLDEVLAVGDAAFQQKCYEYFAKLREEKKTVVLVTHSMDSVRQFCNRALMISDGKIEVIGNTEEVAKAYAEANKKVTLDEHKLSRSTKARSSNSKVNVLVKTLGANKKPTDIYSHKDDIVVEATITSKIELKDVFLGLNIKGSDGKPLFNMTTHDAGYKISEVKANKPCKVTVKIQNIFKEDTYRLDVSLKSIDRSNTHFVQYDVTRVNIMSSGKGKPWSLRPRYTVDIK